MFISIFFSIFIIFDKYSFKDIKIGIISLGVIVLQFFSGFNSNKQASTETYLMTPLPDTCTWVLHVQSYRLLGIGPHMSTTFYWGLCELGRGMPCSFSKSMSFGDTKA